MKPALLFLAVIWLAGCECGPGVACKTDSECGAGRCETLGGSSGYCVARAATNDAGSDDAGDSDAGTDAGSPLAVISSAPIDFGLVGCGKPQVFQDLDLVNAGSAPLTFTTSLSGASGFTVSAGGGSVDGGSTARLSVGASVPSTATAAAAQQGTLTITTNDPRLPKVEVPLKLESAGVTLALTPGIASFGGVPVNTQAPDVPLTLTNLGNVAATVGFAPPANAQFSLAWTGAPGVVTIDPGLSAAGLSAGFRPIAAAAASSSAMLTVAEATCGISVASIPLTGQGTNGVVGIAPGELFFGTAAGRVNCGAQAANRTLTLTNTGNQAFSWSATLGRGASSPFSVAPASGTVPATTGSVTLTVSSAAIPSQASTATDAFGDTLSIVTDVANDGSHLVALHQTANGAILSFAPTAIDFGAVPINTTASAPFGVVNDGNAPATVALASSNPSFGVSPAAPAAVAGTSQTAFTGTFAPGASVVPQSGTLSLSLDGGEVLCAPLPAPLAMSGFGTNGAVSYTPVALDFGAVNCGASAAAKTLTFSNSGNQNYTVVPSLGKGAGSAFNVSMTPDSGVVAQDGGTLVITVTPKPIPQSSAVTPNLYGDTLTVASDVAGDSPHDIPLRETARGAIFAISTSSIDFGAVAVGVTGNSQFTASNTGNAAGTLQFAPLQTTVFSLPPVVAINAGTAAIQTTGFTPQAAIIYSDAAAVSAASGTVLCQPLPVTSIGLAGSGSASNVVLLSAGSLTFGSGGLVPCGSTAPAQTVNVTNNSSQTLNLQLTLAGGAASPYAATGPATVAAGTSVTVTVTPKPIPATSPTAPDAFADSLSVIATGGPVNETHVVALHQTAQGAILGFSPPTLSFSAGLTGSQSKNFTVDNTGNLAAPYSLTLGGSSPGNYSVTPTAGSAGAGGSGSESVTFSAPLLGGTGARNATIGLSTSVVRCAPLPSALILNGTIQ